MLPFVQRTTALRLLAPAYVEILRLDAEGFDTAGIAMQLSLDESAVGPALEMAKAKLASLEAREEPTPAPSTEGSADEEPTVP